jgi:cell division septation protein DedD
VDRIAALNGDQQSNGFGTGSGLDVKDAARLGGESSSGAATPRMEPIGPKQVTTVKVNADGTIIRPSLDETGPSAQVDEEPIIVGGLPDPVRETNTAAVSVDESRPVPVRVVEIKPTTPNANAAAGGEDATRSQASGFAAASGAQDDGGPVPRVRPDEVPDTQVARVQPSQTRGLVAQPSPQGGSAPVNLLDSNASARQPAPTPVVPQNTGSTNAASGYLVQLSAQRSEDQALAAFNGMKAQFPSLLGDYQPSIQRADLGSRGIYYRVRVGPMSSQGAANEFCEQLKSSGGNCFVTR